MWFLLLGSTIACFRKSVPPTGSEAKKYDQMLLKRPQAGLGYDGFGSGSASLWSIEFLSAAGVGAGVKKLSKPPSRIFPRSPKQSLVPTVCLW